MWAMSSSSPSGPEAAPDLALDEEEDSSGGITGALPVAPSVSGFAAADEEDSGSGTTGVLLPLLESSASLENC